MVDIPGGDGQYYFGSFHKSQTFTVNFAFDDLTREDIRDLKKYFSGKDLKELVFSESAEYANADSGPNSYKIYMAKVTSQPSIKYIPFDNKDGIEIYKGEGNI